MGDEIKKIAVVKEVNLTQKRTQLESMKDTYATVKAELKAKEATAEKNKLTEDEISALYGKEKVINDDLAKRIQKVEAYIKDVEDSAEVTGEDSKCLKTAKEVVTKDTIAK